MELISLIKKNNVNALINYNFEPNALYDDLVFLQSSYPNKSVRDYILEKTNCTEKRMLSSLAFVNLSDSKLSQSMNTLSSSEKIKIELVIQLILNKEQIILYQFDKYFMEKDLFFFKKLFKKLVSRYNKTIVCIETGTSFMLNFVEQFIVLTDKNEIKVFGKEDICSPILENYLKPAPILDFIKYANKNQQRIKPYTDIKELIKEIYREV